MLLILSFCHADLGGGKSLLSDEEVGVLDKLVVAGPALENFEITDELLRYHELAPSIDTEVIKGDRVGVLGAKVLPSAFQTLESNGQGQDMVNLDLVERKRPGARPVLLRRSLRLLGRGGRRCHELFQNLNNNSPPLTSVAAKTSPAAARTTKFGCP